MEKNPLSEQNKATGRKKIALSEIPASGKENKAINFSFQELLLPTPRNYHHCQKVDLRNYFLRRSGIKASGPPIASILTGLQAAKDFLD